MQLEAFYLEALLYCTFYAFPKELMATLGLKEMGKFLWEGNLKNGLDTLPLSLTKDICSRFFYKRLSVSDTFKRIYFGLGYDFGRREFRI